MVTVYYTFGYGHRDPQTGASLADTYAKVTAPTADDTRMLMHRLYGNQWAFDYPEGPQWEAMQQRYSLRQHLEITLSDAITPRRYHPGE